MMQAINDKHSSDLHHPRSSPDPLEELVGKRNDGRVHLLLAASGSVATIKIPIIIKALEQHTRASGGRLSIRLVLTHSAGEFLKGQSREQPPVSSLVHLPGVEAVYDDADEWAKPWQRGDSILHIELRRWADMMVIAPLGANTLAKIVNGMCDNLLTSVHIPPPLDNEARMFTTKLLFANIAPAMNTAMYEHPITAHQLRVLGQDWGVDRPASSTGQTAGWFEIIQATSKELACGDVGEGAMAPVETIVKTIEERLGLNAA